MKNILFLTVILITQAVSAQIDTLQLKKQIKSKLYAENCTECNLRRQVLIMKLEHANVKHGWNYEEIVPENINWFIDNSEVMLGIQITGQVRVHRIANNYSVVDQIITPRAGDVFLAHQGVPFIMVEEVTVVTVEEAPRATYNPPNYNQTSNTNTQIIRDTVYLAPTQSQNLADGDNININIELPAYYGNSGPIQKVNGIETLDYDWWYANVVRTPWGGYNPPDYQKFPWRRQNTNPYYYTYAGGYYTYWNNAWWDYMTGVIITGSMIGTLNSMFPNCHKQLVNPVGQTGVNINLGGPAVNGNGNTTYGTNSPGGGNGWIYQPRTYRQ